MSTLFTLYRILTICLSPILLGHIIWLSIKNNQSRYFWQRLGFKNSQLPKNAIWFHCASVGEVNTLLPLLQELHVSDNELQFIITTNTVTGAKIVAQQKHNHLHHCYLPFDWFFSVNRFLNNTIPNSLYVMETEIWPTLFTACNKKNIPVSIINARLSKKTTTANRWIKSILRYSLSKIYKIYARSEQNANAYLNLGADNNKIETIGNLKYAAIKNCNNLTTKSTFTIKREYILIASTHDDEELNIYNIYKKLDRHELLIIAPRHPERNTAIVKKLNNRNIAIRSKDQPITNSTEIFLLDTVGELKDYFYNAKIVVMGGSFAPIGGHNILEPARYNAAIITGPHMDNFEDELQFMRENKAIIQVENYDELEVRLTELLDNKDARLSLEKNTGKLEHNAEQILKNYTDVIKDRIKL